MKNSFSNDNNMAWVTKYGKHFKINPKREIKFSDFDFSREVPEPIKFPKKQIKFEPEKPKKWNEEGWSCRNGTEVI